MKILIQGRLGGHRTLYPKSAPKEFSSIEGDMHTLNAKNSELLYNKIFYTLAIVEDGYIYGKYIIGRDVERKYLGEIGIAVFVPKQKKIAGKDVKELLDQLIELYKDNYMEDGYKIINPSTNYDWELFTAKVDEYNKKLSENNNFMFFSGKPDKEPAFTYYKTESDLIEYLDNPYQDEYRGYKQILLIDEKLKGVPEFLESFKNTGNEVNPDIDNVYFNLKNYPLKGVDIKVNDKSLSAENGQYILRANDKLTITYQKDKRYYEPIKKEGQLVDKDSEIHSYIKEEPRLPLISIDDSPLEELEEKTKTIEFKIKDRNNDSIKDAKVLCKSEYGQIREAEDNKITFKGEEIINSYEVSAELDKNNYSRSRSMTPYEENEPIVLKLQEHKKIEIRAIEESSGDFYNDAKITIKGKKTIENTSSFEFVDNEIDEECEAEVEYSDKNYRFYGKKKFFPKKEKSDISIKMQKTEIPKKYEIDAGEKGEKTEKCPKYYKLKLKDKKESYTKEEAEQIFGFESAHIKVKRGHELDSFEIEGEETLKAKYKKKKFWSWRNVLLIFILLVLGAFVCLKWEYVKKYVPCLFKSEKSELKKQATPNEVGQVNSDSLVTPISDTFSVINNEGDSLDLESEVRSPEVRSPEEPNKKEPVKRAQRLPKKVEPENITEYLEKSNAFEKDSIDEYYRVSDLTDSLNNSLRLVKNFIASGYQNGEKFKKNVKKHKFLKNNPNINEWVNKVCKEAENKKQETNADKEIIKKIKGNSFNKKDLENFKNKASNKKLKTSIKLCLKFWELDATPGNSYYSYKIELNKDKYLKDSKLKKFVDECGNQSKYVTSLDLPKKGAPKLKLSTIIEKLKK